MKTTLQIKLLPDGTQHSALKETMRVFNDACNAIAEVAFREQCASKFALQKLVYADVRKQFGLSAQLTIRAIAKVVEAYKRDKSKQCFFKPTGAVVYDQRILSFKGLDRASLVTMQGRVSIPIQMGQYQRVQWHRAKGQADLVLVKGAFFLLVVIDTPEAPPIDPSGFIGIDLGITKVATDSDGGSFCGSTVERVRQRYHRLRRRLQSKGTRSAKRHLKKIRRKEAQFRRSQNHIISKRLVEKAKDTGRGIALEALKHIRSRTTVRKSDRAKHSGWSFFQLQSFIEYKAKLAGVFVQYIDPWYTSRTCSACGHADKANRKTQSHFQCVSCGYTDNADINAAINIAARADVMQPMVMRATTAKDSPSTATSLPL
ncbi:RNA-guided endonuclease InsQ/TnpB family protein [Nitrosococcus oceani]|uniref:RNA-guided endonuclease InsQ/TnpB family protein n=1 Tax=Nitrosococcus oceani TaxID=1229 RepID=UPI0004E90531|nr:RNA-guided endonuclease TnpB family protein [Nitrosococcus oceani]KFI21699.1 transposase [Nitrosococcus oceani]